MAVQLDKLRRVGYHKLHGAPVNGLLHLMQIQRLDVKGFARSCWFNVFANGCQWLRVDASPRMAKIPIFHVPAHAP